MKFTDIFWNFLLKRGIYKVFGVPGGAIDNILSSKPKEIEWINTGHELQDGFLAQIYGNYTNNVGILIVTTGPGIATAISALKNADSEANPLMIISTYEKSHIDNFQYWDILDISKKITKYTFYIKSDKDIDLIQKAYNIAKKYTTGVLLLINDKLFIKKNFTNNLSLISNNTVVNNTVLKTLENELTNKNTLIVLGKGKFYNYNSVVQFIKRNKLPYITTWKGRYIIPNTLYCGRIGTLGNHSANYAIYHATHILIIGDVSSSLVSNFYLDKFSVILIKNKKVFTLTHRKEIAVKSLNNSIFELEFFEQILDKLSISVSETWIKFLTKSNLLLLKELPAISELEKYISIAAKVYKKHKLDVPVTTGVGNHWYGVGKFMESNTLESSTNWASIGVSFANAIGLYYATGKHIWAFEGDGGTIFSLNTLMYIINNDLPMTVTIFINNLYSAVSSSFTMKGMKSNDTNNVPNIPWLRMLPNCHIFNSVKEYEKYLDNSPISTKLRFIIINLGNRISDSHIYEININKEYKINLKNSNFKKIIKSKLVIKSE
uniref:Thiamine pyrophosphate enzyme N-terminal TPP-binding domain-containing protein n=1 Tax=viral metagenome TaxID=1070528 RepID=A0A6C0I0V4_9ZZZZ